MSRRVIATLVGVFIVFACSYIIVALLSPLLPHHFLHGDERYYIGRALQDVEFYMGVRPARAVWFSSGNHPFSAETIIGLSVLVQGEFRSAPSNPWKTPIDEGLLVSARRSALVAGVLGVAMVILVALEVDPFLALIPLFFLLASPGFVDFSMRCMLDIYLASFTVASLSSMVMYLLSRRLGWLIVAGIFEGLALGSKTGWDPLTALLISIIAVLSINRSKVKPLLLYLGLVMLSFSATSTVIVVRLWDHIRSVLLYHAPRFRLENLFAKQALIIPETEYAKYHYNIFSYQSPTGMLLVALSIAVLCLLITWKYVKEGGSTVRSVPMDKSLLATILVIVFLAITTVLTASTFEFGRNYARLTLYECLALVLSLSYLLRGRSLYVRAIVSSTVTALLVLATHSYWTTIFGSGYYSKTGRALMPQRLWFNGKEPIAYLIPPLKLIPLIPYSSWLILASIILSLTILSPPALYPVIIYVKHILYYAHNNTRRVLLYIKHLPARMRFHHRTTKILLRESTVTKTTQIAGKGKIGEKITGEIKTATSISSKAASLLEKLRETESDESYIYALAEIIKEYEHLKGRTMTIREALKNMARENLISYSEAGRLAKDYEAHIYGSKPLSDEAKNMLRKLIKNIVKHLKNKHD